MLAVSNTSPLSNLAWIHRLDLVWEQFPELWIPDSVRGELDRHPDQSAREAITSAIRDSKLKVGQPDRSTLLTLLETQLDRGEADAIALALQLGAEYLLIDELEGRTLAAQAGLKLSGTLGILLRAKLAGRIGSLRDEIGALRRTARFFLSSALELKVLQAAGE